MPTAVPKRSTQPKRSGAPRLPRVARAAAAKLPKDARRARLTGMREYKRAQRELKAAQKARLEGGEGADKAVKDAEERAEAARRKACGSDQDASKRALAQISRSVTSGARSWRRPEGCVGQACSRPSSTGRCRASGPEESLGQEAESEAVLTGAPRPRLGASPDSPCLIEYWRGDEAGITWSTRPNGYSTWKMRNTVSA